MSKKDIEYFENEYNEYMHQFFPSLEAYIQYEIEEDKKF